MTVAHADRPIRVPDPSTVNPLLSLALLHRDRSGGLPGMPANEARLLEFIDAPIVLGARKPETFTARLVVRTPDGSEKIHAFADIAMRELGDERAVVLTCQASDLTLALVTELDPQIEILKPGDLPPPVLVWTLASRSADATARADVLDFLYALHLGGSLAIINVEADEQIGLMEAPGAPFDPELERDRQFLSDVSAIEEWSGVALPLPTEVAPDEVGRIQEAAEMVRRRAVPVRFTEDISATVDSDTVTADELLLEQDFGVNVFGYDLPLGVGRARLPVKVSDTESEGGMTRVSFRPIPPERSVVFELEPPEGRLATKRTLIAGEVASDEKSPLPESWIEGEREADRELHAGLGIRFTTEEAFFEWLAESEDVAT